MRRPSAACVVVFGAIAAIYVAAFLRSPMEPIQGDGYYTWLWARSLAFDGDLALANDYALCGDPWGMATPRAPGLGPQNQWNPGPAIVWAPMLLVGRVLHAGRDLAAPAIAQGCQGPVADVGVFGTVLMALLGLWLSFRLVRRYVSEGPALLATAGVALASPLPYYACYLASYGHAPAAFAVALFLERWDGTRGRRGAGRWALLGGLLGLAMLMRPQNAVLVLGPLAEWIGHVRGDFQTRDRRALAHRVLAGVAFVALLLFVFAPQLYLWRISYGSMFAVPQGAHYMRWAEPGLDGVLFASTGGLLVWTPLLWLSFVGLVMAVLRRPDRAFAGPMLLALGATIYVNAAVWDYWGSMGFSNRRFTFLTTVFVFGMALPFERFVRAAERRPRQLAGAGLAVLVAFFAAWNFAAMRGVANFRIDSWREAPWEDTWNEIFAELSKSVHETVGNPFAWPASIPFAIAHQTHPSRYDAMRGMSIFYAEYQDRRPRRGEETAQFTKRLHSQYLVEGFEEDPRKVRGRQAVLTTGRRARMLIPFFIEDVEALEVTWAAAPGRDEAKPAGKAKDARRTKGRRARSPRGPGAARVQLAVNDHVIAQMDVPPRWRTLRIGLPEDVLEAGVNELVWTIEPGRRVAFEQLEAIPNDVARARLGAARKGPTTTTPSDRATGTREK